MAAIQDSVRPGDVISSELMARIIALLNAHDAALGGGVGGMVVPNLFGRTIADARLILQLQQLTLGSVIDVFGALVNPSAVDSAALIVLNQVPAAGIGTSSGAAVSLVVSGVSGGTGPSPQTPQINQIVQASARAGETIEIRGSGFAGSTSTVSFNGIAGTVLQTSNQTRIFVTVPPGIPGAPALPTDPPLNNVPVRVANPGGGADTASITILPPLATPLTIGSISTPAIVGQPVTITGTGFSTTGSQNVVSFGTVNAGAPTAASATQLTVTVPTGIPGLVSPGDSVTVNVVVTRTADAVRSNAFPLTVDR
jgi:IPT/TIG domain